ncbi:hypothetical protein JOD21_002392 [Jeotgalibacillus terrae]|nr:hypothetical protein [Jeotgalibacillus terrae]
MVFREKSNRTFIKLLFYSPIIKKARQDQKLPGWF